MAVFYELNYVDDLYYVIDTYNHFLSNNIRMKEKEIKLKFTDIIKSYLLQNIIIRNYTEKKR